MDRRDDRASSRQTLAPFVHGREAKGSYIPALNSTTLAGSRGQRVRLEGFATSEAYWKPWTRTAGDRLCEMSILQTADP